jgi:hypothetical protein
MPADDDWTLVLLKSAGRPDDAAGAADSVLSFPGLDPFDGFTGVDCDDAAWLDEDVFDSAAGAALSRSSAERETTSSSGEALGREEERASERSVVTSSRTRRSDGLAAASASAPASGNLPTNAWFQASPATRCTSDRIASKGAADPKRSFAPPSAARLGSACRDGVVGARIR